MYALPLRATWAHVARHGAVAGHGGDARGPCGGAESDATAVLPV